MVTQCFLPSKVRAGGCICVLRVNRGPSHRQQAAKGAISSTQQLSFRFDYILDFICMSLKDRCRWKYLPLTQPMVQEIPAGGKVVYSPRYPGQKKWRRRLYGVLLPPQSSSSFLIYIFFIWFGFVCDLDVLNHDCPVIKSNALFKRETGSERSCSPTLQWCWQSASCAFNFGERKGSLCERNDKVHSVMFSQVFLSW